MTCKRSRNGNDCSLPFVFLTLLILPFRHDYDVLFGVNPSLHLNKAERLIFGDSSMTHAMVFTAVSFDVSLFCTFLFTFNQNQNQKLINFLFQEEGTPVKFRVENSWGEDRGVKGFLLMTAAWFKEFVFEVVVDKKYVPKEVLDVFQQEPKVLPAWDPMGTLANVK